MKHIKQLLPNVQKISNGTSHWKLFLIQNWESIMGTLANKVSIHHIYSNSIILGVCDSSWMHELYMLSDLIKKKINENIDQPRITTIRFKFVTHKKNIVQDVSNPIFLPLKPITLSAKEKKALEKIKDPELIDALTRLLQKCHQ